MGSALNHDEARTAVISQRGMAQAIGFSNRGDRLVVFAGSKTMEEYMGRDLREKLANPIVFQPEPAAAENPVLSKAHGYDATVDKYLTLSSLGNPDVESG